MSPRLDPASIVLAVNEDGVGVSEKSTGEFAPDRILTGGCATVVVEGKSIEVDVVKEEGA